MSKSEQALLVKVVLNGTDVHVPDEKITAADIKARALEQGAVLDIRHVLEEIVGDQNESHEFSDDDSVHPASGRRFQVSREPKPRSISIEVNAMPVLMQGRVATGADIKSAAIRQGVHIQQNFVLQEELPNGTSKIIGDDDTVRLRPHLSFTAIAPDDNS